jgi:hypothetical protein
VGGFVFFGGFDRMMSTHADLEAIRPYVFIDSGFTTTRSFGAWDETYFEVEHDAYSRNQKDADFSSASQGGFFAHQRATFRIEQFDSNLRRIRSFGVRPSYWRDPPRVPYLQTQSSVKALSEFIGSCTTYWKMCYDDETGYLLLDYANLDKDYFFRRTLLAGQHYLQIYNSDYDCIFDGPIPGVLAFVKSGRVYVLTHEQPEFIRMEVSSIVEHIP